MVIASVESIETLPYAFRGKQGHQEKLCVRKGSVGVTIAHNLTTARE